MSKEMKHVITKNGCPILFGKAQTHDEFLKFSPVSAGFFTINFDEHDLRSSVECYGESVSLKIKSDPNDCRKIELMLNEY
jgi:hypothetical protein